MSLSLSLSAVQVRKSVRQYFLHLEEIALKTGACTVFALLELRAKLVQEASYRACCENAVAHSILACWRNWILGKKADLSCQTAVAFVVWLLMAFAGCSASK